MRNKIFYSIPYLLSCSLSFLLCSCKWSHSFWVYALTNNDHISFHIQKQVWFQAIHQKNTIFCRLRQWLTSCSRLEPCMPITARPTIGWLRSLWCSATKLVSCWSASNWFCGLIECWADFRMWASFTTFFCDLKFSGWYPIKWQWSLLFSPKQISPNQTLSTP